MRFEFMEEYVHKRHGHSAHCLDARTARKVQNHQLIAICFTTFAFNITCCSCSSYCLQSVGYLIQMAGSDNNSNNQFFICQQFWIESFIKPFFGLCAPNFFGKHFVCVLQIISNYSQCDGLECHCLATNRRNVQMWAFNP